MRTCILRTVRIFPFLTEVLSHKIPPDIIITISKANDPINRMLTFPNIKILTYIP